MRQLYLLVNSVDGNYLGNRSRNVQNGEEKKKTHKNKPQTEMISALKVPYWKAVNGNGCFTCALPSPSEACSLVSLGHYSLLVQLE